MNPLMLIDLMPDSREVSHEAAQRGAIMKAIEDRREPHRSRFRVWVATALREALRAMRRMISAVVASVTDSPRPINAVAGYDTRRPMP
jgi:hypothetical protein